MVLLVAALLLVAVTSNARVQTAVKAALTAQPKQVAQGTPAAPQAPAQPRTDTGSASLGITWGPAGAAPQDAMSAATALGISPQDAVYLTELFPAPGNDTRIGWVLGTTVSQDQGVVVTARTVQAGLCVDYDPGASNLTGIASGTVDFTRQWRRTLLSSAGTFSGLKATFYWTPCVLTGGTPVIVTSGVQNAIPQYTPAAVAKPKAVPLTIDQLIPKVIVGWSAMNAADQAAILSHMSVLPNTHGEGLKYNMGPEVTVTATNLAQGRLDGDGWTLKAGQAGSQKGVVFTYWFNG
jgi:hypothetical protein